MLPMKKKTTRKSIAGVFVPDTRGLPTQQAQQPSDAIPQVGDRCTISRLAGWNKDDALLLEGHEGVVIAVQLPKRHITVKFVEPLPVKNGKGISTLEFYFHDVTLHGAGDAN